LLTVVGGDAHEDLLGGARRLVGRGVVASIWMWDGDASAFPLAGFDQGEKTF